MRGPGVAPVRPVGRLARREAATVGDVIAVSIVVGGIGACWLYAVALDRWLQP
jgi:hypothetical protein